MLLGDYTITRIPCLLKHGFFPQVSDFPSLDVLYICNPNNPTAIPYTAGELKELIVFAKKHRAFLFFMMLFIVAISKIRDCRVLFLMWKEP